MNQNHQMQNLLLIFKRMNFDQYALENKSPRDNYVIKNSYIKRRLVASGHVFLHKNANEKCNRSFLILQEKETAFDG